MDHGHQRSMKMVYTLSESEPQQDQKVDKTYHHQCQGVVVQLPGGSEDQPAHGPSTGDQKHNSIIIHFFQAFEPCCDKTVLLMLS